MNGHEHRAPLYAIRRSVILFLLRLGAVQLLLGATYVLWRWLIEQEAVFGGAARAALYAHSWQAFLGVTVVQVLVFFALTLSWYFDFLLILPTEIVHRKGVVARQEQIYPYQNIQALRMRQSVFGRMLNYGTISIFISTLGYELHFHHITNPEEFMETVEQIIHASGEKPAQFLREAH